MLFEQNIASNVTRNQKYKHLTNLNIAKERPSTPKNAQARPSTIIGTIQKLSKLKKPEFFDFHEMSDGERRRRKKKKAVFRFASNN